MLVFSLRRGEAFYVQDLRVELVSFTGAEACFRVNGDRFWIEDGELHHLLNWPAHKGQVRIGVGKRQESSVRVAVDAPTEVKVLREKLYRAQPRKPEPRRPNRHFARAVGCLTCRGTMRVRQGSEWVPCEAAQDAALPICDPPDTSVDGNRA